MDDWGKFNETFLPKKDELYSYLDMEDITDAGYMDEKKFVKFLYKEFRRISRFVSSNLYIIAS